MNIDKETIQKLAHLAKLDVNPDNEDALISDMKNIISWVKKLEELDTSGIDPLTHMSFESNVFRSDVPKNELTHKSLLKNAPDHQDGFFKVPKVLD
jgi:aspartyl-tRNA(Asn)/glutamyl-tRNA(Gln) amidotransferase subunit C